MQVDIAWNDIQKRYDELASSLASAALDNQKRHTLQKEMSYISTLLNKHKEIERLENQQAELIAQRDANHDADLASLYAEEIEEVTATIKKEQDALDKILFPPDPQDNSSVFLEIRAGTGGQEASLFAADLLRMYINYALKHKWHASIASESTTDLKGYREVVLHIEGRNVYGHLKFESGVHRVQRVPATETAGRIHTSTATVAVLPEVEESADITINPSDLRIDVYRSSGAGGQHVNTTDSAVRITHIPTGVVVTCQEERSQHKNKAKAMKMLQSRLVAAEREKNEAAMSQQRKELVGTGMRAEKVRTYNYPQNRITDHQIDLTLKKLDVVMEGSLDEIITALQTRERELRRQNPLSFK